MPSERGWTSPEIGSGCVGHPDRPGTVRGCIAEFGLERAGRHAARWHAADRSTERDGRGRRCGAPRDLPGHYVVIEIKDTGVGMSADVVRRAFEPFFTTKGAGKGSGLGLAMVYGFARQSGGTAEIESQVGSGTTIKLYFRARRKPYRRAAATRCTSSDAADGLNTGCRGQRRDPSVGGRFCSRSAATR